MAAMPRKSRSHQFLTSACSIGRVSNGGLATCVMMNLHPVLPSGATVRRDASSRLDLFFLHFANDVLQLAEPTSQNSIAALDESMGQSNLGLRSDSRRLSMDLSIAIWEHRNPRF